MVTEITCSKCGTTKPTTSFNPRPNSKLGYISVCRECLYRGNGQQISSWLADKLAAEAQPTPPAAPDPATLVISILTNEREIEIHRADHGVDLLCGTNIIIIPWEQIRLVAQILNALCTH